MGQKLTLVVTCTDRKSLSPLPEHQVRNLSAGPHEVRAAVWTDSVSRAADRLPLSRLYQGEAWTQVARLSVAARDAGFHPEVRVLSAGLGLRTLESEAPAYSATFSPNRPDSVASDRVGMQTWWQRLSRSTTSLHPASSFGGPTAFVLSETYTGAIAKDLAELADRDDVLVFGGARGLPEHQRLPADRALRKHLGGTLTSLNLRMATAWFRGLTSTRLIDDQRRGAWLQWIETTRAVETFDRKPVNDEAVLDWIRTVRQREPGVSKSKALRMLRDSGLACEQRRFGRLFADQVEAR